MIGCIVQARLGSSRLPAKIAKYLAGATVLEHVMARVSKIDGVNVRCLAMPDCTDLNFIASVVRPLLQKYHFEIVFGPESDVISRFLIVEDAFKFESTMRVTADCPLLDPIVCSEMLRVFQRDGFDYMTNADPRSFPHGLDCEIYRSSFFRESLQADLSEYDREHVTPWMRNNSRHKKNFSYFDFSGANGNFGDTRWVLDYPSDFEFLQANKHLFERYHSLSWMF